MTVEMSRDASNTTEASDAERREASGDRIPFDAVVEVGAALGPAFEAQAVDLSEAGIHLRTAYLPELGQPLTCRFEVGSDVVLAAGEVVWRQEAERGGEFGLRFTDLDATSEAALKKLIVKEPVFAPNDPGSRVRLHIEGLGAPMRARVKTGAASELVVGSELGFLQVGKELELEDARTGGKRPARIDRVGVEINPETNVPQLVVTLRYEQPDVVAAGKDVGKPDDTPEPSVIDDNKAGAPIRAAKALGLDGDEALQMRSGIGDAFHRASAALGPAMTRLGAQAKTTFALVAAKAKRLDSPPAVPRRTTAPPPTGGLHASGRKVVRTEPVSAMDALEPRSPGSSVARRRMAIGTAVAVAGVLAVVALRKPNGAPATPAVETAAAGPAAWPAPALPPSPDPIASATLPGPANESSLAPPAVEARGSAAPADEGARHTPRKPIHVAPFGNGAVSHGNVLHLKMDGPIEKIEGATTPTGFTVVIPDRRSLEAAAPLAARDSRIAAIRVTNDGTGAELSLSFRDGVPNYQVRARGDTLEIALAGQGKLTDDDGKATPRRRVHPLAR
jgi:hypothetical protein